MTPPITRRTLLSAVAATGTASLAGCSSRTDADPADGDAASDATPTPVIPSETLAAEGWKQMDKRAVSETTTIDLRFTSIDFTAAGESVLYEAAPLRQRIREETLGHIDQPLRVLVATKLNLSPNVLGKFATIGQSHVLNAIEGRIEATYAAELDRMGLEGFERVEESTLDIGDVATARLHRYRSTFPHAAMEIPITSETSIEIPSGELAFDSLLALWMADGALFVGGGGYPAENFTSSTTAAITDAITTNVEIDLRLEPDAYRQGLANSIAHIR